MGEVSRAATNKPLARYVNAPNAWGLLTDVRFTHRLSSFVAPRLPNQQNSLGTDSALGERRTPHPGFSATPMIGKLRRFGFTNFDDFNNFGQRLASVQLSHFGFRASHTARPCKMS